MSGAPGTAPPPLGWLGILRLGLVQTALGAIVVLTTSTMNRIMVVELALPAVLPGALVALHYALQVLRPRLGYGSDLGGRRTPWIVGGMGVLGLGGVLAAVATALMARSLVGGIALAVAAFALIGVGVGACGTSLLVLLAKRVDAGRRPGAATLVWIMMIAGFAVTAGLAGHFLDPYDSSRLIAVTACVAALAFALTLVAVRGLEPEHAAAAPAAEQAEKPPFREALRGVWAEPQARRFTIFVFVSMLAYSAQDLILEPFAGAIFGMTPGASTKLSGVQHGGVMAGMILAALAGRSRFGGGTLAAMRGWTAGGCVASALALAGLAGLGLADLSGAPWMLQAMVLALGVANGAYAVSAIGAMMGLAAAGRASREGVRMGLWGAAQAVAFGLGGFLGAAASDLARIALGSARLAYATVFAGEAVLFLVAAMLALGVFGATRPSRRTHFATSLAAGTSPS